MTASKPWWTSKTVWLGVLELIGGILIVLVDSELTTGDLESILLIAVGVLTVLVRFLTDRPIRLSRNSQTRAAETRK